jgi:hypothetical protein
MQESSLELALVFLRARTFTMREKAFKIALFAGLSLVAPCAHARSAKATQKHAAKVAHKTVSFYVHRPEAAHGTYTTSRITGRKHDSPERRNNVATRHPSIAAHTERVKRVREASPTPVVPAADETPIAVRHNRKIHRTAATTPGNGPQAANDPPRAAAIADFLPSSATDEGGSEDIKSASAAKPVPVAKVIAKATDPVESAALAAPPAITPVLFNKRGRLVVPPAMKGSHEILLHQNQMADRDGLDRVQDDDDLAQMRESKALVAIPSSSALAIDERLPMNRRYCRPWTAQFLTALAKAHYARFHTALQVNSAVRTVEFQERLRYTNGNAAPAEGETASPHLTGQAVDLAKHGLSLTEIAWLRGYLLPLVQEGKVDVEEEFQQACFHISVYKKYMPEAVPKRVIPNHRSAATALAAAIR